MCSTEIFVIQTLGLDHIFSINFPLISDQVRTLALSYLISRRTSTKGKDTHWSASQFQNYFSYQTFSRISFYQTFIKVSISWLDIDVYNFAEH